MSKKTRSGVALIAVVVCVVIFTIMSVSLLSLAKTEIVLTRMTAEKAKAFYLAEAGLGKVTAQLRTGDSKDIDYTPLGAGQYHVNVFIDQDPACVVSTGHVANGRTSIKAELSYLAVPFENAIYAGGVGGKDWMFALRGLGDPRWVGSRSSAREVGGSDQVNGNVFVDGEVILYEESSVNPAPLPNEFGLGGDVEATRIISVKDRASISGASIEGAKDNEDPDMAGMSYQTINTHDVGQLFADEGIGSGYLPYGHDLRNVVVKNPSDRPNETSTTSGDDYFLEPASVSNNGADQTDARTPLNLGENRIYYVDGDVWIHNKTSYGFLVEGRSTIVATGDIHISDNIKYADDRSVLGLVALGNYDSSGQLVSGGNIWFGDPRFGTTYTVSALMFAANNFMYNTDSVTGGLEEPTTGFTVFGNLAALNQVSIERDWYTDDLTGRAQPARFDAASGQWTDLGTGSVLTEEEINGLRHYRMEVGYDERVRVPETQPPGLPRGKGTIFAGLKNWEEVPWAE